MSGPTAMGWGQGTHTVINTEPGNLNDLQTAAAINDQQDVAMNVYQLDPSPPLRKYSVSPWSPKTAQRRTELGVVAGVQAINDSGTVWAVCTMPPTHSAARPIRPSSGGAA